MRNTVLKPGARRSTRGAVLSALVLSLSLGLSACSSDSSSGDDKGTSGDKVSLPKITDPAVQAVANQALGSDGPVADMDPAIQLAFRHAALDLTDDQLATAYKCWKATTCDIGSGDVTLGIADGFGQNTWRKFTKMEIILQALTYPEIGRIISTDAAGDLNKYLQNVRSLGAQGAKAIVGYNDFGDAALPAFTAVQKQGAFVSTYVGGVPGAKPDQVANQVHFDECQAGDSMADIAVDDFKIDGQIALLNGTPGNPQGAAWNKCLGDKIKGTSVAIGTKLDTDWTPAGTYKAAAALVSSGKDYAGIFNDYADPLPQVVSAYEKAGKKTPDLITITSNNGLFKAWNERQGTDKAFDLYYTSGLNWMARASLTAVMTRLDGGKVTPNISVPIPFVKAAKGVYASDRPTDYPGPTLLVPDSLVKQILGK